MVLGVSSVFAQTASYKPKIYLYDIQLSNTVSPAENRVRRYLIRNEHQSAINACIDIKPEGTNGLGLPDGTIFLREANISFLTNTPLSEEIKNGMAKFICTTKKTEIDLDGKTYSTKDCKVTFSVKSDFLSDIELVIEPASTHQHDHKAPITNDYSLTKEKKFPKFSNSCFKNILGHNYNLTTQESRELLKKLEVDMDDIETIAVKGKNIHSYLLGYPY